MSLDAPPSPRHGRSLFFLAALILALLGGLSGCGGEVSEKLTQGFEQAKDSVSKGVEQAKESVSKGVEQAKEATQKASEAMTQAATSAKEAAGLSGKITLDSNPPVATSGAYASFVPASEARAGALQVQSYAPDKAETFPSVFVRSLVAAKTLNELVGQTVPCEIFVQSQADGPVWRVAAGDSAQLKLLAIEGKLLKAQIVGAQLHETSAEQQIRFDGQIEAMLP